jgi:uncharacterized protein YbjQ (UPF0145 family)
MFTSGITPREAAMTEAAGLRPLGQVAGTCVYHSNHFHGMGPVTGYPGETYRLYAEVEAVLLSRRKALRRLSDAARALGADLVTGVRVAHEEHSAEEETGYHPQDKYGGIVEATATGYAVAREQERRVKRKPVLVTVSAGEYWKLGQGGYAAVGMVMATVMTGCTAASGRGTVGEISEASAMVRAAWQSADKEIRRQAHAARAQGVVGVSFSSREWLADPVRLGFKMILTVTGTSIGPLARNDDRAGAAGAHGGLVITPVRHLV